MKTIIKLIGALSLISSASIMAAEGNYETIAMGDGVFSTIETANGSLMMGNVSGTAVITNGAGLFKTDMTNEWTCLIQATDQDGVKVIQANCTAYFPELKSSLFTELKRKTGNIGSENDGGDGLVQLTGGTGQLEGISGTCEYSIQYIGVTKSDTKQVCSYSN